MIYRIDNFIGELPLKDGEAVIALSPFGPDCYAATDAGRIFIFSVDEIPSIAVKVNEKTGLIAKA